MDRNAKTVYLFGLLYILRKRRRPRRWWVRQIFMERKNQGAYHNLLQEMRLSDKEKYFNYLRMSHDQFLELLRLIGPVIEKLDIRREPIGPAERLAATLRYLASGDSMVSISYSFRLGKTTVSNIINETCKALWNVLKDKVFFELTERYWQEVSKDFEDLWQLPHCIGAIDGKHVIMQAPPNCGSQFFNYKGSHSIVLLALCDAKYRFITVDFGAQGRQSDGGVFRYSDIGQCLLNNKLNLPPASPLEIGSEPMHYYVAGDSAFPLTEHLMHPYSGKFLTQYQRIFNYRLSRGRRVSENAFGILASRWRILRKPIISSTDTVESIVGAIVTLHNWIINQGSGKYCSTTFVDREDPNGDVINGEWRLEPLENNLQRLSRTGTNNYKKVVEKMRDDLALYFFTEGALPFQWDK